MQNDPSAPGADATTPAKSTRSMTRTPRATPRAREGAAALDSSLRARDARNGASPEAAEVIKSEGEHTPIYPDDPDHPHFPFKYNRQATPLIPDAPLADGFEAILAASAHYAPFAAEPGPGDRSWAPQTPNHPTLPTFGDEDMALDPPSSARAPPTSSEQAPIQAFALLEFDDGQYYMNTFAVYLGRDMVAQKMALLRELEARYERDEGEDGRGDGHRDGRPPSSGSRDAAPRGRRRRKKRRRGSARVNSSVVSESGGIVNLDLDDTLQHEPDPRSAGSSGSRDASPRKSLFPDGHPDAPSAPARHFPDEDGHAWGSERRRRERLGFPSAADTASPYDCPIIPIHPPAAATAADGGRGGDRCAAARRAHRGISRRHVQIAYNFQDGRFEAIILGRNGAFVDEVWCAPHAVLPLRSGSCIQIGGVALRFLLPNAPPRRRRRSTLGSEGLLSRSDMSLEFEDGRGDRLERRSSSETSSSRELVDEEDAEDVSGEEGDEEGVEDEEEDEGDVESEVEEEAPTRRKYNRARRKPPAKPKLGKSRGAKTKVVAKPRLTADQVANLGLNIPADMIPPRRRGPGRPPKNGIMSKREEALLKKQIREQERQAALGHGAFDPARIAIDRDALAPEKRKYAKRKPHPAGDDGAVSDDDASEPEGGEGGGRTAGGGGSGGGKKLPPRPRSPSPEFDVARLTAEQKAKPTKSYVTILHEVLGGSSAGPMSLAQIYRAMVRRYPYYKVTATSNGWQSSVRHNLAQNAAFTKVAKEGKGHLWALDPAHPLEPERRRRPTPPAAPPPRPPPNPYAPGARPAPPPFPYHGMPPPGPNGPHGLSTPLRPGAMYPPGGPNATTPVPPGHHAPPGVPYPFPPPNPTATNATYQSPYATGPSAQAGAHGHPHPRPTGAPSPHAHPPPATNPFSAASTSPAPAPPPDPADPALADLPPHVRSEIDKFQRHLLRSLPGDPRRARATVTRAVHDALGRPPPPGASQEVVAVPTDAPQVAAIAGALGKMLTALGWSPPAAGPAAAGDAGADAATGEAKAAGGTLTPGPSPPPPAIPASAHGSPPAPPAPGRDPSPPASHPPPKDHSADTAWPPSAPSPPHDPQPSAPTAAPPRDEPAYSTRARTTGAAARRAGSEAARQVVDALAAGVKRPYGGGAGDPEGLGPGGGGGGGGGLEGARVKRVAT